MELLVLVPLAGFILFMQRWQQTTVSTAALHTTGALILLLYAGGLAGILPETRLLLLGLGTALLAFELFRHPASQLRTLGSAPMLVLFALSMLFFLLHQSSGFRYYDEFSHWGILLKDMLANGTFSGAQTNSLHPSYPPGPALWQYLFVFGTPLREGAAYFAQFLLLLIPVLVLFESLGRKQAGWAAGIVVLLLFGLGNFGHGIASLYADHVLAMWLAGLFLNFMAEPRPGSARRLALYVLPLSALALIKNAGLFFSLALTVLFFALLILRLRDQRATVPPRRIVVPLLLGAWLAGPLLVNYSWSLNRDAAGTRSGTVSAPGILGILSGRVEINDPERAQTVRRMFTDVFVNQQLSKNRVSDRFNEFSYQTMPFYQDRFRLTTATFLALFLAWSALLIAFIVPPPRRPDWAAGLAGLFGIALTYIALLFLTYLFFRENLVSYIRYVHSVALALLLAAFAPLVPAFARPETAGPETSKGGHLKLSRPAIFTFALLALVLVEKPHIAPLAPRPPSPLTAFRDDIRPLTDSVRRAVGGSRLWLYLPDPNPHNFTSRVMLYELAPTPTTINRDFGFFDRPRDEILADWESFDYVWIVLQSEELDEKLRATAGPDLGERLYRVEVTDGKTGLQAVPLR